MATMVEGEDRYQVVVRFEQVHSAGLPPAILRLTSSSRFVPHQRRRQRRLELATKPARWATTAFRRIRFDRMGRGGRARGVTLRLLG